VEEVDVRKQKKKVKEEIEDNNLIKKI